jgi:hypothetical protein
MLSATQTAALKRVTKKLSIVRKTLTKAERQVLDLLITGATTEVAGHRAANSAAVFEPTAKKGSKRAALAAAEVSGHQMDWRLGKKDPGMVREGGMAKDQSAAEVMGHSASVAASANVSAAAANLGFQVAFNAATNSYVIIV